MSIFFKVQMSLFFKVIESFGCDAVRSGRDGKIISIQDN